MTFPNVTAKVWNRVGYWSVIVVGIGVGSWLILYRPLVYVTIWLPLVVVATGVALYRSRGIHRAASDTLLLEYMAACNRNGDVFHLTSFAAMNASMDRIVGKAVGLRTPSAAQSERDIRRSLERLLARGYVEQTNGNIYAVTASGRVVADRKRNVNEG